MKDSKRIIRYLIINLLLASSVGILVMPLALKIVPHYMSVLQIISTVLLGFVLLVPNIFYGKLMEKRLSISRNGCQLLIVFLMTVSVISIYLLVAFFGGDVFIPSKDNWIQWIKIVGIFVLLENILFWSGIIRIYVSSAQLGLKWRIIGIVCGLIPIVHLVVLIKLIKIVSAEIYFENDKLLLDENRKNDQICKTKYPILLVHGVFFRDFKYLNYWGRIPKELVKNGATCFTGNHQSAAAVADSARELDERIKEIVQKTGCEKVNIIAHSKGGLDSRYAISRLGTSKYVASLTTINTPHRGCEFADFLLNGIGEAKQQFVARTYNSAFKKLGDENPDFLSAVYDLTASSCAKFNQEVPDAPNVLYQSIGSKLNKIISGRFPLNMTYQFVKYFDGDNDGLVGEKSFRWGSNYKFLVNNQSSRGISHGDMIDLNRENIKGFDVREFYVQLVADLKKKGY
ncbi:esterase/lipase family protein [Lachnobacterium bovis]|uniref:esterase/lipase family protein n=1 Tax=Lachnobacterium bovis TaxID=140626 RepID=UPI0003B5D413|nr:alpha/beta fold hydrolase [Lachnobacterium bovis]